MPEPHPGLVRELNDRSLPLKVVKVYPPYAEDVAQDQGDGYMVQLKLSRRATHYEAQAIRRLSDRMRFDGSTLTVRGTTLEMINEQKDQIKDLISQAETRGARAEESAADSEAMAEAAHEADVARLEKAAAEINFD